MALAVALALSFAVTNGVHDASNAIAALVATRAARPLSAVLMAAAGNLLGPLVTGGAVAGTIGGIVTVGGAAGVQVIGAGLLAAVAWNAGTWALGLPSSSGHALVGGLVGAGLAAGGAVDWRGSVLRTLIALAISPLLGALAALLIIRAMRRAAGRATRRWRAPARAGEWAMSAALAFSHGANDAQKSVGAIAALMIADGRSAAGWAPAACALALTVGTTVGGWRIVKTVGRRIYRIGPLDAVASQSASAAVILGASLVGAPVSTTQVVASSVLGVGGGRRRWRHINWGIVRHMAIGWLVTLPATAALAALALAAWRTVG